VHARVGRGCEDEPWCPHFHQTRVVFKAGGAPMQDCNGLTPVLSCGRAQFASALDHLCCYLAERSAKFIYGCVFAGAIECPLRGTQHRATAEHLQSGLAEPYRALKRLLNSLAQPPTQGWFKCL
jgi:hypothetical protein